MGSKFLMTLVGAIGMLSSTARASFIFDFQSVTPLGGGQFAYHYDLDFGSNNSQEELLNGDFATVFDIVGFVSATAPAGFTTSSQLTGVIPPFQAPPDSPSIINVTYTYTGVPVLNNTMFTGFTIVSTVSSTQAGFTSGQDTAIQDGTTKLGDTTGTTVPLAVQAGVPEPGTLAMIGAGFVLLGAFRARRQQRE